MTSIYLTISLSTHNGDDTPQNSSLRHLHVRIPYPGAVQSPAVTSFNKTYPSLTTKHQTPH